MPNVGILLKRSNSAIAWANTNGVEINKGDEFIDGSYVRLVEQSGGRPIKISHDDIVNFKDFEEGLMSVLHGIVIPDYYLPEGHFEKGQNL